MTRDGFKVSVISDLSHIKACNMYMDGMKIKKKYRRLFTQETKPKIYERVHDLKLLAMRNVSVIV